MKVYRFETDFTRFRSVNFDTAHEWPVEHLRFSGAQLSTSWTVKSDGYWVDPRKEIGDFNHFLASAPLVGGRLLEDENIFSILEMSGELLPIQIAGENFFVWNIT